MICRICYQEADKLYHLAECQHQFCLDCCLQHITHRSQLFAKIVCAEPECRQPFNHHPFLMDSLPYQIRYKIDQFESYEYLQNNRNLRPCAKTDCSGYIDMRQNRKECGLCHSPHCPKCLKLFHSSACVLNQHDQQMRNQNLQKCPHCFIWVEKAQGCFYIKCKCGTAFCYRCGALFSDDPCRIGAVRQKQLQMQQLLSQIKFNLPQQKFRNYMLTQFNYVYHLFFQSRPF